MAVARKDNKGQLVLIDLPLFYSSRIKVSGLASSYQA